MAIALCLKVTLFMLRRLTLLLFLPFIFSSARAAAQPFQYEHQLIGNIDIDEFYRE